MTTIVYILGICWFGKSCFGKSLEFWIQKSVRNLFAQYDDVIESKQSHPLPTPHSTSEYNPCVNEILSMVKNDKKVIVTLYELACSNNTSLLKPSFLRVSSELVCCTQYWHYYVFFPHLRKHNPWSLYFVKKKKKKNIYICIYIYIYIYNYLLLYKLQFLEGFLLLRKTVTDRT